MHVSERYAQCRKKGGSMPCPKCGKDIVIKRTQKGRRYYGCIGNPECDYMVWQKPTAEK
ncbi:MAG: topoisomerase DNA-binding C4 zinc finger domain-containing protein [Lachnospiraceae bacterium]|nr:topoisomerase DNA-binding C4 zinc finger domain-containing protein [Lachnospiraceae bacterium]